MREISGNQVPIPRRSPFTERKGHIYSGDIIGFSLFLYIKATVFSFE
jgi:hypothetical protein